MQGKPKLISLHAAPLTKERPSFTPHSVYARTSAGAKEKRAIPVRAQPAIGINHLLPMEPAR